MRICYGNGMNDISFIYHDILYSFDQYFYQNLCIIINEIKNYLHNDINNRHHGCKINKLLFFMCYNISISLVSALWSNKTKLIESSKILTLRNLFKIGRTA